MFIFVIFHLGIVVSIFSPIAAETSNSACQTDVDECTKSTESAYRNNLNNYDFVSACPAMQTTIACYNKALKQQNCQQATAVLNTLKIITSTTYKSYCPNGQPDPCLVKLRKCVLDLRAVTSAASKNNNVCNAVHQANACVASLNCPGSLNTTIRMFMQEIDQQTTSSNCTSTQTCSAYVNTCLAPVLKNIAIYQKSYDFPNLCQQWKHAKVCFTHVDTDPDCAQERSAIDKAVAQAKQQYSQYCDANDNPRPCLKDLDNCANYYSTFINQPLYGRDPLYTCQSTISLIHCIQSLPIDPKDCPAISQIQAIANLQHSENEAANNCSSILTSCTSIPANCTLHQDLQIKNAMDLFQYNKVCSHLALGQKCVDPYINSPNCKDQTISITLLLNEKQYFANMTSLVCQVQDESQAKPCLQKISSCSTSFVKTAEATYNSSQLCKDLKTYNNCVGKINCQEGEFQTAQLNRARTTGQSDLCHEKQHSSGASINSLIINKIIFILLWNFLAANMSRRWLL